MFGLKLCSGLEEAKSMIALLHELKDYFTYLCGNALSGRVENDKDFLFGLKRTLVLSLESKLIL